MVMAGVTYDDIKEIILIAIGVQSGLWEDLSRSGCYNNHGAENVSWLSELRMAEIAMTACMELVEAMWYGYDMNMSDVEVEKLQEDAWNHAGVSMSKYD